MTDCIESALIVVICLKISPQTFPQKQTPENFRNMQKQKHIVTSSEVNSHEMYGE